MNTFSRFGSRLFRGSVSSNSYSYINRQNVGASLDPSGTDYIDYSNNNAYFTDSHNINPNDENTTSLILNNSDSNYLNLSSLDEFTIYMKYQVYDSSNIPVIGQIYNNPNYDISFSNSSPLVGDSFQVYVLNGSGTTLTYSISGDFTSANLNGASLTGSLPYIENILDYTISSGGGEFKFLLNVTDVSGILNIIKTYWVTVQDNLFGEKVFAISETGENGTFYNQKSLTFTTGDSVRFDVSDPSNTEFILDFGSTIDSVSVPYITRTGIPGQSSAIVALTVPETYSGDVIYYFEDSSANMGYKPAIREEYFQDILIVADFSENLFTSDASSVWDIYGYKENTYIRNETTNTLLNGTYVFRSDRSSIALNMNVREPKSVISSINNWCRFERYVEILFPFFIRVESSQVTFVTGGVQYVSDYYLYGIDAYDVSYELLDVSGATWNDPVRIISSNKHFKKLHIEGKDDHTRIKDWAINGYVIDSTSLVSGTTLQYEVTVSNDVFYLDGSANPQIDFVANNSYLFDQSDPTNADQQIVFGYIRDNSSNIFTSADGVTIMGTPGQPGAYTYLDLSAGFTGTLYYYSDGSANMGMDLLSDFAYSFSVKNNIYDEPVWAVYDDANSIYYNQPDLSFSAPYVYEFDVSDPSNNDYVLSFGTTVDVYDASIDISYVTRSGTPGTNNAKVFLDLTNYSGDSLVYFEDSSANMGYSDMSGFSYIIVSSTLLESSFDPASVLTNWITDSTQNYNSYTLTGESTYSFTNGNYDISASDVNSNDLVSGYLHNVLDSGSSGVIGYDWHSLQNSYNNGSPNLGVSTLAEGTNYNGSWIQLHLPYQLELTQVGITGRGGFTERAPKDVVMVGSNDNGTTFEVIDSITFSETANYQTKPVSTNKSFSLIRMVVSDLHEGENNNNINIEYWELSGNVYEYFYNELIEYTVTVSNDVFYLDGSANPQINFVANNRYVFYQPDSTNAGQQIVFGYEVDNSANILKPADGVTVMGTPGQLGAYTQLDLSAGFVGPLYYYSDGSANMGYGTA
jgi:hypothetical protein